MGGRLTATEVQQSEQSGGFVGETPRAAAVTRTAAGDGGTELCVIRTPLPSSVGGRSLIRPSSSSSSSSRYQARVHVLRHPSTDSQHQTIGSTVNIVNTHLQLRRVKTGLLQRRCCLPVQLRPGPSAVRHQRCRTPDSWPHHSAPCRPPLAAHLSASSTSCAYWITSAFRGPHRATCRTLTFRQCDGG